MLKILYKFWSFANSGIVQILKFTRRGRQEHVYPFIDQLRDELQEQWEHTSIISPNHDPD